MSKYGWMGEDWRFSRLRPFALICGMSKYGRGKAGERKAMQHMGLWGGRRWRGNTSPPADGGHGRVVEPR